MLTFGLVSSVFDFLTFGVLLLLLHADATAFRTGWFLESVVSAALVVLVVRSRRPLHRSRPAAALVGATLLVAAATVALPYTPLAGLLGFTPLPVRFLVPLGGIVAAYIIAAEAAKHMFYGHAARATPAKPQGAGVPPRATTSPRAEGSARASRS